MNKKNCITRPVYKDVWRTYSLDEPWDVHVIIHTPNAAMAEKLQQFITEGAAGLGYDSISGIDPVRQVEEFIKPAQKSFRNLQKRYDEVGGRHSIEDFIIWLDSNKILDKCLARKGKSKC